MASAVGVDCFRGGGMGRFGNRASEIVLGISMEFVVCFAISTGSTDPTLIVSGDLWSFISFGLVFALLAFCRGRDVKAARPAVGMGWRDGAAFSGAGRGFEFRLAPSPPCRNSGQDPESHFYSAQHSANDDLGCIESR